MSKLYLILSIHNHQPVGNFDHVFEEVYRNAYLPFLELLLRHRKLKIVLHYSGNLLLWLEKRHPEALDMISALIKDNRVELLSGGLFEPILSSLPEDDRVMQIRAMTSYIKDRFRYSPKGMWLAERVWEPQMPKFLKMSGIEYLSVDDYHFRLAGVENQELLGYHITEDEGHSVKIFPGSERLRYLIPFRDIDTVFSYFREVHMAGGSPLLTMADDGEKFGEWPDTYKHCHTEGWLENFFSFLEENSDWIETTTFDEYQKRFYPVGKVYLPTASYREMGEWTLPPEAALDYAHVFAEMEKLFGERTKSLLRGGIWRSFLAKYPESNHIHKRMLMISRKVHKAVKKIGVESAKLKVKNKPLIPSAQSLLHELWKGQCNDAYWHGIFGGLYLPHLRSSLYRHLLKAEALSEKMLGIETVIEEGDSDCDGFNDICISKGDVTAFFTEESGALVELSIKKKQLNVLDVLTRRPEAYHSKIMEAASNLGHGGTKTIHDRLLLKEEGLIDYLLYDNNRRVSLLDHFFDYNIKLDDIVRSEYEEQGDFIGTPYKMALIENKGSSGVRFLRKGNASGRDIAVGKSVLLRKSDMRIEYSLDGRFDGIFGMEFNLSFLGSPYAYLHFHNKPIFIKDTGMHSRLDGFYIRDEFLNLQMEFLFDDKTDVWHYPIETISLSEKGIEKLYQGTSFLMMNKLNLNGTKNFGLTIKFGEGR